MLGIVLLLWGVPLFFLFLVYTALFAIMFGTKQSRGYVSGFLFFAAPMIIVIERMFVGFAGYEGTLPFDTTTQFIIYGITVACFVVLPNIRKI